MARLRPATLIFADDSAAKPIPLAKDEITLGRSEACDVVVADATVSRLHARITREHDRYAIADAGSFNGTFVNGERLAGARLLTTGDTIWLGASAVALSFADPDETLGVDLAPGLAELSIDESAHVVSVYGEPAQLSTLEYQLACYLAKHARVVCTREECFQAVWGQPYDHATCEDALNACVARLRRNLRAAAAATGHEPPAITTIKRVGLRLDGDVVFMTGRRPVAARERAVGEA